MRKYHKVPILILIVLSLYLPVNAETQTLSFYAKMGIASPFEDHIHSGLSGAFGLALHIDNKISVSIDLNSWKSSVDEKLHNVFNGKMTLTPLLISLKYSLYLDNRIYPYTIIGGGYVFTHFRMDDLITIPEITISQEVMGGLCFHAGVGALVKISKSFGLVGEGVCLFRKSEGVTTITDMNFGFSSEEFSVRLNTILFQVGIVYFVD
jgi:hypothetical protein